ncbi:hypothetical protein RHSIM_Rhsim09G0128000 [Rhododendron simsii]|uniref:Oxidoreductase N-terminal domain-containing protein n=1 Tax=Rhododendron simsii TaxID=118357 RepID=A0A834GDK7_RHOSS|nr:hypothetical protein RHSIM_RhsimUnG0108500 [Rhododendron simsii]KAF7131600.1 hypothetical protein RHSIM_Rhsim09G0128000 [Rhododendron simsii]
METAENKQVIFKGYIDGVPKETDMEVKMGSTVELEVVKGSGALLVKNLYLSCDPYMRGRMRQFYGSYIPPFVPGSVIEGFGVSRVVDSDNPNFKTGDLVTGITGWEEYSLIHKTEQLRKIQQDDIPLSYYVGLLGIIPYPFPFLNLSINTQHWKALPSKQDTNVHILMFFSHKD